MKHSMTCIYGGRRLTDRKLVNNSLLAFDACFQEQGIDKNLFQTVWQIPENWIISPGFVEIHLHGMGGKDVMDGTLEALETISAALVPHGVTTWLATTMTMEVPKIQNALIQANEFYERQKRSDGSLSSLGAKLAGVHLEGPYISPALKGAQDAAFILPPNFEQFERDFYQLAPQLIKHVTCAPEMEGAIGFISALKEKGISVALGHSGCSFDQALAAKAAGANHVTHFFNAMPQAHHREPGLVGAGLMADLTVEWIADGVHFRPEWFSFLLDQKQEKSVLVTDAMCAAGLCPGHYSLGGQDVLVDETSARLTNGVLAGSVLTMDLAVRNMAKHCEGREAEILYAASSGPADAVGLKHTGKIAAHFPADCVLLNEALEVQAVWVDGKQLFVSEGALQYRKGQQEDQ